MKMKIITYECLIRALKSKKVTSLSLFFFLQFDVGAKI